MSTQYFDCVYVEYERLSAVLKLERTISRGFQGNYSFLLTFPGLLNKIHHWVHNGDHEKG